MKWFETWLKIFALKDLKTSSHDSRLKHESQVMTTTKE